MSGPGQSTVGPVLSDAEYRSLCEWVYLQTGMVFDDRRRDVVENRLGARMQQHSGLSVQQYLRRLAVDEREAREFLDLLTVNETYFFRDLPQMTVFRQVLEEMVAERRQVPLGRLRVWSAGCSIGCEPYTLAMCIQEELDRQRVSLEWHVLGTDISPSSLEVAESALYSDREVRDVPPDLLKKYFRRRDTWWEFSHPCKNRVQFRYSNLLRPGREVQGAFDIVFCRNVLIYFDDASRRQVAETLFDLMVPGGYLFLGASESMSRISRAFQLRRVGSGFVYIRP
ncbi:CheR family methyltransferase [Caldinitratiruptor microaerophilus]|uniref:protein-glutamate O-methyltransferase n=1 Tax=Caldinitratiruptor microaerophilus TaxID=671077 RepID=A0AA35CLF9_9FIRM|nr:protein-glutamate O-methyltransferase CheR [Caldinitratiruptor microaerophilus]BDG61382.1 chemotaxis protein methyltransferase [Caldinitratiruptor microaerophilus]